MKLLELETSQLTLVADSNKLKYLIKIKLSKVALKSNLSFFAFNCRYDRRKRSCYIRQKKGSYM